MKKINKAFTLIELIVVITILVILGTIAFISLQGYSKSARDSRRISDINNIKTSLELFILNTGYYPEPDDGKGVYYSGELLWNQGLIGDVVTTNLSRNLQKKPLDPLLDIEYIYSVTHSQKEYEVMSFYEGELSRNNIITDIYATDNYYTKVEGAYNQVYLKTPKYIIPTPSIINSEVLPLDLYVKQSAIESMIITGGDNFPNLNISNTETQTGQLDVILSVTGSIDSNSTSTEKVSVIEAIQTAYSGTALANNVIYEYILSKTIFSDKVTLFEQLVTNNGGVVVSNDNTGGSCIFGISKFGSCNF